MKRAEARLSLLGQGAFRVLFYGSVRFALPYEALWTCVGSLLQQRSIGTYRARKVQNLSLSIFGTGLNEPEPNPMIADPILRLWTLIDPSYIAKLARERILKYLCRGRIRCVLFRRELDGDIPCFQTASEVETWTVVFVLSHSGVCLKSASLSCRAGYLFLLGLSLGSVEAHSM